MYTTTTTFNQALLSQTKVTINAGTYQIDRFFTAEQIDVNYCHSRFTKQVTYRKTDETLWAEVTYPTGITKRFKYNNATGTTEQYMEYPTI